jgi:hypothetical protein
MIQDQNEFFQFFEENVTIYDEYSDPDSIFEVCKKAQKECSDDCHMVCIIDNYANISKGEYKNKHEAVSIFSSEYVRLTLCKQFQWSVLAIVQSDLDTEKYAGRNAAGNIQAVEPTLGSFGDNKLISRDVMVVWALFNPWRYGITAYPNSKGYNTDILRNRFRALLMLKNNLEEMAPRLGLYFEGGKGIFTELPSIDNEEALRQIYDEVLQNEAKIRNSRSNQKT